MGHRRFTAEAYTGVKSAVERAGGDTSYAGRQHIRETKKLHPLVDPSGYGLIRKSWPRYVETPAGFCLEAGMPMLDETLFDTTGSMGRNVKLAFNALPKLYKLLTEGNCPVLGRYDTQILNAIFGDVVDQFILARTQAEMDEKIAEQLTLMVPEHGGGDGPEDPEYGLFAAAFLTDAFINRYGLKSYHFMVTDATSHGRIDRKELQRVFGETVFKIVAENGCQLDTRNLPGTGEIVSELKKRAHAFLILIDPAVLRYWRPIYGYESIIAVNSADVLPFVEAAIIGLTEGVLDIQSVPDFLQDYGCERSNARSIQRAVASVPVGVQSRFENFDKIPGKGSVFAHKHDLWPVSNDVHMPIQQHLIQEELEDKIWL